jgi:hypothetical protein
MLDSFGFIFLVSNATRRVTGCQYHKVSFRDGDVYDLVEGFAWLLDTF